MLFLILAILSGYILLFTKELKRTINDVKKRYSQIDDCKEWCTSKGYVVTFTREEQRHCWEKCDKFSYPPPIFEFLCEIGCKPFDSFLRGSCMNSEFCKYYINVNSKDVTEAVRVRWISALANKMINPFNF